MRVRFLRFLVSACAPAVVASLLNRPVAHADERSTHTPGEADSSNQAVSKRPETFVVLATDDNPDEVVKALPSRGLRESRSLVHIDLSSYRNATDDRRLLGTSLGHNWRLGTGLLARVIQDPSARVVFTNAELAHSNVLAALETIVGLDKVELLDLQDQRHEIDFSRAQLVFQTSDTDLHTKFDTEHLPRENRVATAKLNKHDLNKLTTITSRITRKPVEARSFRPAPGHIAEVSHLAHFRPNPTPSPSRPK